MKKKILLFSVAVVVASQGMQAYAWGRDEHDRDRDDRHGSFTPHYIPAGREVRSLNRDFLRLYIGGMEYFFWEGMYYRRFADRYVVVQAPIGAVVTAIPPQAQMVIVDGVPYYTVNGVTYISTTYGYQVVPPPKLVVIRTEPGTPQTTVITTPAPTVPAPMVTSDEAFSVNIPNSRGTYTAIAIRRSGNGFVGPQGEYYTEFPKVEQLKLMYGK